MGDNDWWPEVGGYAPGYYYFESIDGDWEKCLSGGNGTTPAAFKVDKFKRILPSDNLNEVMASNTKTLMLLFAENAPALTNICDS